jgi:uncharacterized protein YerC
MLLLLMLAADFDPDDVGAVHALHLDLANLNSVEAFAGRYTVVALLTIQYNTIQYNALHALHCIALHCIALQYNTIQYNTNTIQYTFGAET